MKVFACEMDVNFGKPDVESDRLNVYVATSTQIPMLDFQSPRRWHRMRGLWKVNRSY